MRLWSIWLVWAVCGGILDGLSGDGYALKGTLYAGLTVGAMLASRRSLSERGAVPTRPHGSCSPGLEDLSASP
jgi:hypothetical protein